jgi:hypothetical protein
LRVVFVAELRDRHLVDEVTLHQRGLLLGGVLTTRTTGQGDLLAVYVSRR